MYLLAPICENVQSSFQTSVTDDKQTINDSPNKHINHPAMVLFFTSTGAVSEADCYPPWAHLISRSFVAVDPPVTIYMGKDKFESGHDIMHFTQSSLRFSAR